MTAPPADTETPLRDNLPAYSVSEISFDLKRSIEERYGHVRVRGEIGRVSRPASGHVYLDLKDEKAVLSGVIWKGVASGLRIKPEQGLEVIATGRLTTFPGQSKYQIVIESLEPAGLGALMALLEERKKKLAAEGLFAEERKCAIPYLPEVVGVVTSPSGAVIRDILHRLADRFPRRVIVWPVRVQGETSAAEVARAIEGFNRLEAGGAIPRPDVLIVARGGGSLEDLWSFNEEIVARAAAASEIPLISAVGHETDTTLIDFVSDRRAPTPTAAAEIAVPVRAELVAQIRDKASRLERAELRLLETGKASVVSLGRGLPRPQELVQVPRQRFDYAAERLGRGLLAMAQAKRSRLDRVEGRLNVQPLRRQIRDLNGRLTHNGERLGQLLRRAASDRRARSQEVGMRLTPAVERVVETERRRLDAVSKLLVSYSYQSVLERGFALVRDEAGRPVRGSAGLSAGDALSLEFAEEDRVGVVVAGGSTSSSSGSKRKTAIKKSSPTDAPEQGSLL